MDASQAQELLNAIDSSSKPRNKWRDAGLMAMQGAMWGAADEAGAATDATLKWLMDDADWKKAYNERLPGLREDMAGARENLGNWGMAAETLGALPTSGVGLGAKVAAKHAVPPGLLNRIGKGMFGGAAAGGAYGFAEGEGGAENRARNAVIPAGAGGLFGAAVPAFTGVGGNMGHGRAIENIKKNVSFDKDMIQPTLDILEMDTFQGTRPISMKAAEGTGKKPLFTDQPNMFADVGTAGRSVLNQALLKMEDGAADPLRTVGDDVKHLFDEPRITSGDIRKRIIDRTHEKTDELRTGLEDMLGEPKGMQELKGNVSGTSKPGEALEGAVPEKDLKWLYDAAYPKEVVMDNKTFAAVKRLGKKDINQAAELMIREGVDPAFANSMAKGMDALRQGVAIEDVKGAAMPNVQFVDYVTRGLADKGKVERGKMGVGSKVTTQKGSSYERLSSDLRDAVRGSVPEYDAALSGAAKSMKAKSALDLGFEAMNTGNKAPFEKFEAAYKALKTPEEKLFVSQGAIEALYQRMYKTKENLTPIQSEARQASRFKIDDPEGQNVLKIMSTSDARKKMELLLGKESADKMRSMLRSVTDAYNLQATTTEDMNKIMSDAIKKHEGDSDLVDMLLGGKLPDTVKKVLGKQTGNASKRQEWYGKIADHMTKHVDPDELDFLFKAESPEVARWRGRRTGERTGKRAARMTAPISTDMQDRYFGGPR